MAFKQDANGSLTSCQICHTLYYKARTKITYALARRGFPVAVRGKRAEYWAIFDISILLLAVALGYISAQETLHCHRGGRKGEGESRDGNGSREGRIFRWLEGGQGSDWITAIRILIKFNLPPSSFLPHGWQVAGNHENRHSSLWAQGESPITLQLIGGKKKKTLHWWMDAERIHVQSSMTTGGKCKRLWQSTGWWGTKPALREDSRSREKRSFQNTASNWGQGKSQMEGSMETC